MQPNIIYLNSHDTGRWIQPYGYPVDTPNLQRFAEDAVVFRNAFCLNPTCSPSRAALLTGQAPHSSGMLGLAHLGWRLSDVKQHWVHTLHSAGYTSYFTGGQHLAPGMAGTESIGYQHILEAIGEQAWAKRAAELFHNAPDQPFYLEVGFSACHRKKRDFPEHLPHDDPRWQRGPECLPDDPRVRAEFAGFKRLARELDANIGVILAALDSSGLADNTVVVITTDHGIDFPRMKCTLRDDGLGVFLMMRGPQGSAWRGGRVVESMVSHIDVFPTLCEFAGCLQPDWLQGTSLSPLVDGDSAEINDAIFGEVNYHAAYQPMRCVRTRRWKYIRRFYEREKPVPPNQAPCDSRDVWDENGWLDSSEPREELYDLAFDPGESQNLADHPEHEAVKAELRARLHSWMVETDDPILKGHIPLVKGGQTVTWDQLSNHGAAMGAEAWNNWLAANDRIPDASLTAAERLSAALQLEPHPEGGRFRETYRSTETIPHDCLPKRFRGDRTFSTAIYFMLTGDDISALHRIKQDEVWHFHAGSSVVIHCINSDGTHECRRLGLDVDTGEHPQYTIPAGCVFGAHLADADGYALMSCTVAPGFEYDDFDMPKRDELLATYPQHRDIIMKLTRDSQ